MKVADGLTQQGRHPRSTALGEESARPDPPAARARHLSLGSTELWPPAAATTPAAHLLCAPCAPARPRVTEVLQHQPLGSSQPPASKSQGRMWQLREVKGLAQSHTAGGPERQRPLVCRTIARLPALGHAPGTPEPSGLSVGAAHAARPLAELGAAAGWAAVWGEPGRRAAAEDLWKVLVLLRTHGHSSRPCPPGLLRAS